MICTDFRSFDFIISDQSLWFTCYTVAFSMATALKGALLPWTQNPKRQTGTSHYKPSIHENKETVKVNSKGKLSR